MDTYYSVGLILGLLMMTLYFGWAQKKDTLSTEAYFFGDRQVGFFPLLATLLATQLGGGTILGACQEAYLRGGYVIWYPLGVVLGFFLLALNLGEKQRALNIKTISEIFEKIYESIFLRRLASAICIFSLSTILIGQSIAAKKSFLSLGLTSDLFFIFSWSIIIGYTAFGGLNAVIKTDIFQIFFVTLILVLSFAFFITKINTLPSFSFSNSPDENPSTYFSWVFMPMLYFLIEQDMSQRCFAAKKKSLIPKACISSALVIIVLSLIPITLGLWAREQGLSIDPNKAVILEVIAQTCPLFIRLLFNAAIFMAIISTADSLICSISSLLVFDFIAPIWKMDENKEIKVSQLVTFTVGLLCLGLAFVFDGVVQLLILSYELAVSSLFASIFMALVFNEKNKQLALYSLVLGIGVYLCFSVFYPHTLAPFAALACSFMPFLFRKRKGALAN